MLTSENISPEFQVKILIFICTKLKPNKLVKILNLKYYKENKFICYMFKQQNIIVCMVNAS